MELPMKHLVCAAILLLGSTSFGLDAMPGEDRFESILEDPKDSLGASLGISEIDGGYFLNITPQMDLNLGKIGVGIQVPLNLRIWPRGEAAENDYYGLVRYEDWDERAEWLKVIRYVRLGKKRDAMYLRAGELAAEIGHGTILSRYLNNVDLNTRRIGFQFDRNMAVGGFESLIADVGNLEGKGTGSHLLGVRMYWKPLNKMFKGTPLNALSVGFSVITDTTAPQRLATDADGNPKLRADGHYEVAERYGATVHGFDAEIQLLKTPLLDVVPYMDLNFIRRAGSGFHIGVRGTAKLPIGLNLKLPARLEYRRFSKNYMPAYFSSFYEIERYAYPLDGSAAAQPKLTWLRQQPGDEGVNGLYGDAAFDFVGLVQIGALYEAYLGYSSNFGLFVNVPALETIKFKAYYARNDVEGLDDIFVFDERSMAVAQGKYMIMKNIYAVGQFTRQWTLNADSAAYEPTDAWTFNVEFAFAM
jgi:hypothetical protein